MGGEKEKVEDTEEESVEKADKNKLVGGEADGMSIDDIAKKHKVTNKFILQQLLIGMKEELEHTKDNKIRKELVLDHLAKDPNYYTKLAKIEGDEDELEKAKKNLSKLQKKIIINKSGKKQGVWVETNQAKPYSYKGFSYKIETMPSGRTGRQTVYYVNKYKGPYDISERDFDRVQNKTRKACKEAMEYAIDNSIKINKKLVTSHKKTKEEKVQAIKKVGIPVKEDGPYRIVELKEVSDYPKALKSLLSLNTEKFPVIFMNSGREVKNTFSDLKKLDDSIYLKSMGTNVYANKANKQFKINLEFATKTLGKEWFRQDAISAIRGHRATTIKAEDISIEKAKMTKKDKKLNL